MVTSEGKERCAGATLLKKIGRISLRSSLRRNGIIYVYLVIKGEAKGD